MSPTTNVAKAIKQKDTSPKSNTSSQPEQTSPTTGTPAYVPYDVFNQLLERVSISRIFNIFFYLHKLYEIGCQLRRETSNVTRSIDRDFGAVCSYYIFNKQRNKLMDISTQIPQYVFFLHKLLLSWFYFPL